MMNKHSIQDNRFPLAPSSGQNIYQHVDTEEIKHFQ